MRLMDYVAEASYVEGAWLNRELRSFNDDPACFLRYVLMQSVGAVKARDCGSAERLLAVAQQIAETV